MKKITLLSITAIATLLLGAAIFTSNDAQANTASGWELIHGEFLGKPIGCEPGQARRDYVLAEYNSTTPISNTAGLMVKTKVVSRSVNGDLLRVVRETPWVTDTNIAPAVCYNPVTESVLITVQASANAAYHSYNGAGWWAETADARVAAQGFYLRGYAHLQPKNMAPTSEYISPNNVFVATSRPTFAVRTNDISALYGANGLYRTFLDFWFNGERINRYGILHGGGVGTRQFTPATFADGLYTITTTQQLNGTQGVIDKAPKDISCQQGREKLDVVLLEKDSLKTANLRGLNPRLLVMNKASGTVAQTITFNSNATSPTFCIDPKIHSVNMALTISPSSLYFNSGDVLRGYSQVINVNGSSYSRFNFEMPRRTQPVTRDFTLTAEPVDLPSGAVRAAFTQPMRAVPAGTLTRPVDFYIDGTAPTASVTVTGSSTPVESRVSAVVNVRDIGSGMRSFNLVLIPTRTPGNMASVTVPFAVGAGLIGGPKDAQTVRMSLRVLPGTDYQYYVVATDVAGNRYQTPRQTLRTDNVYADLDASNFRITSTCLPADVGGDMAAICPLTRADVRMNNVGGREITSGTQVPYRIESQPSTGGSWSTVTTGNYSGGLQPGALSNAIPLSLTNLRGGSRLRLVVNLAPQLNNAIGEQNFTNNTSAPLTLTFRQEPPRLLLEVDRTVVRVNETVSIRYEIESPSPVTCELKDGGNTRAITHTTGTTRATIASSPITNSRTITLSCTTPDGTVTNTSVNVSVVPNVQEV